jgi:hypothetical protein
MDKTRSYAWEDSRKVMENEISGSSSAGTGDGSRDLNYDSGTRTRFIHDFVYTFGIRSAFYAPMYI